MIGFFFQMSLNFVTDGPVHNESTMVQIMACGQLENNQFLELMISQSTSVFFCITKLKHDIVIFKKIVVANHIISIKTGLQTNFFKNKDSFNGYNQ